ncbi:F-box/LRR-repeat protein At5g63520 isoform X2 [Amborella trichopoda]|uniref:F-box/LRR-repeat protein At5g63520 isoform X2 n=1 Tax=Amborella trichopoda TaxID=13333 RepID=UPI0005D3A80C|nr:F-box/LRR-repeat protein At5g63520 isoform X2 [Amborella trichopoda]|eukprot:XP_011624870.1 F-box/LRR-repeat protein At5g63520 isoform X2 [Amborella trichopoda]
MAGRLERETVVALPEELWDNILGRLPAKTFARACITCRPWNRICNRVLSRPKFLSTLSLRPTFEECMDEALTKVLSEPIRPHFVMAFTGFPSSLEKTHNLLRSQFGGTVPLVTCFSLGLLGTNATGDEVEEVLWDHDSVDTNELVNRGLLITVGFVPGLKVGTVPLFGSPKEFKPDLSYVLQMMDDALLGQTPIVGCVAALDNQRCFLYSAGDPSGIKALQIGPSNECDAVALVFAKDKDNDQGLNEIHFTSALSTGLRPRGPLYKAAAVKIRQNATWLTARREGIPMELDGERIWEDLRNEVGNEIYGDVYVGVLKKRKRSIAAGKRQFGKPISLFAFHGFHNLDEEYLYVEG